MAIMHSGFCGVKQCGVLAVTPLTVMKLSATIRLAPHDRERIGQLQPIVTRSCGAHLVQVNQLWAIAAHRLVPAGVRFPLAYRSQKRRTVRQ
jgi:hypothetical protein